MTSIKEDRTSADYWDQRAKDETISDKARIWYSSRIDEHTEWVKSFLKPYKDMTVLDVGCGYGRFAPFFSPKKYKGYDFSGEMIRLARKEYPKYDFFVADADEYVPEEKFDLIFAVMLTNTLDTEEFISRMVAKANVAFIRFYAGRVVVESAISFDD